MTELHHAVPPCGATEVGLVVRRFSALDLATATYALCSAAVVTVRFLHGDIGVSRSELTWLLVAHGLMVVLVYLASRARRAARDCYPVLTEWYPLLVLLAMYGSIGLVNGPRESLGLSYDMWVMDWESRLRASAVLDRWGGHPGPSLVSWGLSFSYLAYFPMVIAAPLVLWRQGQHEHARRAILGISVTFFSCYLLFLLFPVAGPNYVIGWPETQNAEHMPVWMVREVIERGDSWGSAFPSSHVAASVAALILGAAGCRRLGTMLLPFALGIFFAVIYFRVHYVLDAVAGLAVAIVAAWLVQRAWPLSSARP